MCIWLVLMAGVDDCSRAPKLLMLMLDLPLDKGPRAMCSAFLPYCVVRMYVFIYFSEGKGGFFLGLSVRVSNQAAVNTGKRVGCSASWTVSECYSASSAEPGEGVQGKGLFCLKLNGKSQKLSIPGDVCRTVVRQ